MDGIKNSITYEETQIRGGFVNTKYDSLNLILDVLAIPEEQLTKQFHENRSSWYCANNLNYFRDKMIMDYVKNCMMDEGEEDLGNIYYKMITKDIPGKIIQLEYNKIFIAVLEDYDLFFPFIDHIKVGNESTLFIFLGINYFSKDPEFPELDFDYKTEVTYAIFRTLLPLRDITSCYFQWIDLALPCAIVHLLFDLYHKPEDHKDDAFKLLVEELNTHMYMKINDESKKELKKLVNAILEVAELKDLDTPIKSINEAASELPRFM